MSRIIFIVLLLCSVSAYAKDDFMYYRDTDRTGYPFAKDPVVVRFHGKYLMYYSVPPYRNSKDRAWNIGIAESKDLTNWEKIGELTPEASYEKKGLCAPGAIVRKDTIHLFYQIYGNRIHDAICHAYSTDGVHFTRNTTNPIFNPKGEGWTCGRAIDAEVCEYKGKYFLYFATRDKDYKIQQLGVATAPLNTDFSRDTWTQATDSSILYPKLPWEGRCIEGETIIQRHGKLYMFYAGAYNNYPQQIGVAESTDGITWKRLSEKPFLTNGKPGYWNASESGHPCIFKDKRGRTYLFYQGNNTNGKTWILSKIRVRWKKGKPVL